MSCTGENEAAEADAVMLKKTPETLSADALSALFPPPTDEQAAEYAKRLGSAAEKERTWGFFVKPANLNSKGADPLRPEEAPPKPSVEIGAWFGF